MPQRSLNNRIPGLFSRCQGPYPGYGEKWHRDAQLIARVEHCAFMALIAQSIMA